MPEFHQGTLVITSPPHYPTSHTRETVTNLAAFGLSENQVAVILRCTADDVRKYYASEMEHGLMRINAQVMASVLHQALYNDDVTAMKLWLVNKAGWRTGDGPRSLLQPPSGELNDGELQVVERRTVIESILTKVTREKRHAEKVIDGHVVATRPATQPPGSAHGAGAGTKKPNGNGSNGSHK